MRRATLIWLSLVAMVLSAGCAKYTSGCESDEDCGAGYFCDPVSRLCRDAECEPQCGHKCCGPDGCGGTCPNNCGALCVEDSCVCGDGCRTSDDCPIGYYCDSRDRLCKPEECIPECTYQCCGPDGCGGLCHNTCPPGRVCDEASCSCQPHCQPDCQGKECGDDGCGGTCPPGCPADEICNDRGQCQSPQTHEGAGDPCHCDPPDYLYCPVTCPTQEGAAGTCMIEDQNGDGFCTFACSAAGADHECRVDFAGGCCLEFGTGTFYCLTSQWCTSANNREYLEPCGPDHGGCRPGLVCVGGLGPDSNESFCLYSCAFPGGDCQDGGECAPYSWPSQGYCTPPGQHGAGDLCHPPFDGCLNGLACLIMEIGKGGYCAPYCDCETGAGCPSSQNEIACAWGTVDEQGNWILCYCGYFCGTADDCPGGGTGWNCQEDSGLCVIE